MNHNFKELLIWKEAMLNATATYSITKKFPREELFALTSQMRRAAISIPSNIAEGCGRGTDAQLVHFLDIALGSAFELETQILIANTLGYIDAGVTDSWIENLYSIHKKIIVFRRKLSTL